MPLQIGDTFAGYQILRLLGAGGMGEVYLAQHPRLPRHDAIKVLLPDTTDDPSFRARFLREADLAAALRHPHIVGIHDRGEHNGNMFIAMDYIDGTDAAQLVQQRYPAGMPTTLATTIITDAASALDHAHKNGLLHRDVKPANIIVAGADTDDPHVYLADFGIARPLDDTVGITTTNMTVGTVAYAAPEQLLGEQIDGRADQYALAATAYHLLTGLQLFPHSNPAAVISRHLNTPPPPLADRRPDCAELDAALQIALAKEPDDRFATCSAFARALTEQSHGRNPVSANATTQAARRTHRPKSAPTTAPTEPPTTDSARRPWHILAGIAATVLLLGAIATLWRPWQHPPTATSPTASNTAPTASSTVAPPTPPPAAPSSAPTAPPPTTSEQPSPPPATTTTPPNPNGPGCSSQRLDKCGRWTPEQVAFACHAIVSGADYTAGLQTLLMNRYGLDKMSAFFLGKEAWYSVSSGGYINTGSMADGPHPLCNDIIH